MRSSDGRPWWTLSVLVLAMLAIGLDATVLSVSLPTLAGVLDASTSSLQWFLAAYTLVMAAGVLPGGVLGDRWGHRRALLSGLALFGLGSVACALSSDSGQFIAARVLAGLGAAIAVPTSLSTLLLVFDERDRARAVGIWTAAGFLALPAGPILGGWILAHHWWGWIFMINVPVVLAGGAVLAAVLPDSPPRTRPPSDPAGILISSTGLAVLTYGIIEAGRSGRVDGGRAVPLAAGLLALGALVAVERRRVASGRTVLVDPRLLSRASFSAASALGALGMFLTVGALFTLPQYFQAVLGSDVMGSGVRLLPTVLGIAAGAVTAHRAVVRAGARGTAAAGFALAAAALALGGGTGTGSGYALAAVWTVLFGVGLGTAMATTATVALDSVPVDAPAVGSALVQTVQRVGAPLGTAVLGSVLNSGYRNALEVSGLPAGAAEQARGSVFAALELARRAGDGRLADSARAAFVHGSDLMLQVCAAAAVLGGILAWTFLPALPPDRPARPTEQDAGGKDHAP